MRTVDVVLFVLASPVLLVRTVYRVVRRVVYWRMQYVVRVKCRSCSRMISLVGLWRCSCGFTYRGHVLRRCPVCQMLPRMVRCFECGATEKLPVP